MFPAEIITYILQYLQSDKIQELYNNSAYFKKAIDISDHSMNVKMNTMAHKLPLHHVVYEHGIAILPAECKIDPCYQHTYNNPPKSDKRFTDRLSQKAGDTECSLYLENMEDLVIQGTCLNNLILRKCKRVRILSKVRNCIRLISCQEITCMQIHIPELIIYMTWNSYFGNIHRLEIQTHAGWNIFGKVDILDRVFCETWLSTNDYKLIEKLILIANDDNGENCDFYLSRNYEVRNIVVKQDLPITYYRYELSITFCPNLESIDIQMDDNDVLYCLVNLPKLTKFKIINDKPQSSITGCPKLYECL